MAESPKDSLQELFNATQGEDAMKVGIYTTGLVSTIQAPLAQWAVVSHNDDSGLGRQAADIRSVLGIGQHLVAPSERLVDKPLSGPGETLLHPSMSQSE